MGFSDVLKLLRNKNNLTQEQLAKKLNTTRSTIAGYETERKQPNYDTLILIADYFSVSIDYLLGRTDIKEPIEDMAKENLPKYFSGKSVDIENLSPESQEDLKKYIKLLKLKDMQKRNSETSDELTSFD